MKTPNELDLKFRKAVGLFVGAIAFVLTEAAFTLSYDWGFAWGLIPALFIAGAFGWMSYRFLWVGIASAALLEMLAIMA